jgi:hypothetical protein
MVLTLLSSQQQAPAASPGHNIVTVLMLALQLEQPAQYVYGLRYALRARATRGGCLSEQPVSSG